MKVHEFAFFHTKILTLPLHWWEGIEGRGNEPDVDIFKHVTLTQPSPLKGEGVKFRALCD